MSDTISLVGLDKAAVFAALYNGARAQGLGFLHYDPTPMTAEQARERFNFEVDYFDYVDGRVMKINLQGDEFYPGLYDRDNGHGAAAAIIAGLRATNDVDPEEAERIHKEGTRRSAVGLYEHLADETEISFDGNFVNMTLGLSDVADLLKPKLDDVLGDETEE